jgi:tRNA-specific 2-thiouridylase
MSARVIVGLSGGVDSAVAAWLLQQAGHDVHALHMTNWDEPDDEEGYCTAADDHQAALAVARELRIPLHRVSFAREYRDRVFRHFLDEYAAGRTPNPDVLCNREVKFGVCLDYARRLGGDVLATGHYARLSGAAEPTTSAASTRDAAGRVAHAVDRPRLLRAVDRNKDQTYFLHQVGADALRRAAFPIGGLTKDEVRDLARRAGLPVHDRPDSTGICFIGERPFREFLSRYLPARPGPIETEHGELVGTHSGLMYYTVGQRQGLGLGGRAGASEAAWYVAGKDVARNVLVVVQGHDHPRLQCPRFEVGTVHWIGPPPALPYDCRVQVRHRQTDVPARLEAAGDRVAIVPETPLRAVAAGQYAVFYDGDECLGGAVIERTAAAFPDSAERAA